MSTTRSQKRRNNQQESSESVCEYLVSPIVTENNNSIDQDVGSPGPSREKSPRVESNVLENLRTSLKDEISSELKSLSADTQKEILRPLKTKTNTNVREEPGEDTENETRSFFTPIKSVRMNSTQNTDPCSCRNSYIMSRANKKGKRAIGAKRAEKRVRGKKLRQKQQNTSNLVPSRINSLLF